MSIDTHSFDEHCEFAIQFLLTRQGTARHLAVSLARLSPERSALEMIFILSLAVSSIEELIGGAEMAATLAEAWRVIALLGVELHMMKSRGMAYDTCADLLQYWQTVDDYFSS